MSSSARRKMKAAGVLLALALVGLVVRSLLDRSDDEGPLHLEHLKRAVIAPGIDLVEADLVRGRSKRGQFVAVYAELARIRPGILLNHERIPLNALAQDALVVANGGYFTPEHRPTGLLVSNGERLSPLVPVGGGAGSGVLVMSGDTLRLYERERVRAEDLEGVTFAIQGGPRVIEPGSRDGILSDDGLRANRTVIGADQRGRLVLAVTYADAARTGASLFELQRLLGRSGVGALGADLALDFALNLDGGTSTGFFLRHDDHPVRLPEATRVHSVLTLGTAP